MSTPLSTVSLHEKSYKMQQNWFELLLYSILNQSSEIVIFEMVDFSRPDEEDEEYQKWDLKIAVAGS